MGRYCLLNKIKEAFAANSAFLNLLVQYYLLAKNYNQLASGKRSSGSMYCSIFINTLSVNVHFKQSVLRY